MSVRVPFVAMLALLLLLLLADRSAGNSMAQHLMKRAPKRYCGKDLSGILSILCKYGYNKRANGGGSGNPFEEVISDEWAEDEDPFNFYRMTLVPVAEGGFRRVTRSLTEECCRFPCSQSTLEQYCKKQPN